MIKNISLCSLIIAGLCFGQTESSRSDMRISLIVSRKMYTKNELTFRSSLSSGCFYDYNFMVPAECESLQLKTGGYGRANLFAYTYESMFATGSAFLCYVISWLSVVGGSGDPGYWDSGSWAVTYTCSNMLITGTCTWAIGKSWTRKSSWWKTSIVSGFGAIIGSMPIIMRTFDKEGGVLFWVTIIGPPALGSVIGVNL